MHRILALALCCGLASPVAAGLRLDLELASATRVHGETTLRASMRLLNDGPEPASICGSALDLVVRRKGVRIVSSRDVSLACGTAYRIPFELAPGASLISGISFPPALDMGLHEVVATYDCDFERGHLHVESEPIPLEVRPAAGDDALVLGERARAIEAVRDAHARGEPEPVDWPSFDAELARAHPASGLAHEFSAFRAHRCDGQDEAELASCLALVRAWNAHPPAQEAGDLAWAEADLLCRLGREAELAQVLTRIRRDFPWHVPISGFVSVVPPGSSIAEEANRRRGGAPEGWIDGGAALEQAATRVPRRCLL